jgi:hypothetical protein
MTNTELMRAYPLLTRSERSEWLRTLAASVKKTGGSDDHEEDRDREGRARDARRVRRAAGTHKAALLAPLVKHEGKPV